MLLILISLACLINISNNKAKESIKNGNKKFKCAPVNYPLKDIIFVFENADIPDTIYMKDPLNNTHTLELSMDYDSKKNIFFNRQFVIDNHVFHALDQFNEYIIENGLCDDFENIQIVSLIDNNIAHKNVTKS